MMRILAFVFMAAILAGPLAACGKKGDPKPPGKSEYPRTYPKAR